MSDYENNTNSEEDSEETCNKFAIFKDFPYSVLKATSGSGKRWMF